MRRHLRGRSEREPPTSLKGPVSRRRAPGGTQYGRRPRQSLSAGERCESRSVAKGGAGAAEGASIPSLRAIPTSSQSPCGATRGPRWPRIYATPATLRPAASTHCLMLGLDAWRWKVASVGVGGTGATGCKPRTWVHTGVAWRSGRQAPRRRSIAVSTSPAKTAHQNCGLSCIGLRARNTSILLHWRGSIRVQSRGGSESHVFMALISAQKARTSYTDLWCCTSTGAPYMYESVRRGAHVLPRIGRAQ